MTTVASIYPSLVDAQQTICDLVGSGFTGGAGWAVGDALRDAGLGSFAANGVVEAICAGAIFVAVHCEDRRVQMARDILESTVLSDVPSALPTATKGPQLFDRGRSASQLG